MSSATAEPANKAQIDYWNAEAGETWAAMNEALDRQIGAIGERAIQALDPTSGERILDIGCGCGQTTAELARRVGAHGAVLAVDISGPMLAVSRRRLADAGLSQARVIQADAQTHAFEPAWADAAFSRFGVMFFADPAVAFSNIRKGLRPGARLAFACWRDVSLNPFMTAPFLAALPLLPEPPPPPDPTAPGPFAFADEKRLRGILADAGFADIVLQPHEDAIGGGGVDDQLELALRIGPLGRTLREQPELRAKVEPAVRQAIAAAATPQGVFFGSASWLVTARNPS